MARGTSQRPQYAPNPINAGRNAAQERESYASQVQRDDATALQNGATRSLVGAATRAGYQLPPGANQPGQSLANRQAIARSVVAQQNGNHVAPNTPTMVASHMPSNAAGPNNPAQLAEDAKTLSDFRAEAPSDKSSPALAAAAGTGKTVATPYGTGSSTTSKTAPVADKTADQSTGPKNLNWQQEIVAKYPAIGQKGTQANADFVDAYKKAQSSATDGSPPDHHAIADQVMKNITTPANSAQTAIAANNPAPDIKAPTPVSPAPTTTFAGQTIPANPGAPIRSPDTQAAAQSAQGAQNAGATVAQYAKAPFVAAHDATIAIGNAASKAWANHVAPFFKGFTGDQTPPAPAPSATPDAPTPTTDRYASATPPSFAPQPLTLGPSGTSTPGGSQVASAPSYSPSPAAENPPNPAPVVPQNQGGSYTNY